MKLSIRHITRHVFDTPVKAIALSLRLYPTNNRGQRVLDWEVKIDGATMGEIYRDGAGDQLRTVSLAGPVTEYNVEVTGTVDTNDQAGVLRDHRERLAPLVWMRPSRLTTSDAAIRKLAERAKADSPLALAHDLSKRVSEAIAYEPGQTQSQTTAAEAMKLGQGVCQDHAHVLIAAAMTRDLPARYVTGYLAQREAGLPHEASHAWAEIWIDGLGWVGFDPANECCPDEHYLRIGCGRDAEDAAPIRGSYRGAGHHTLDVDVAVQQCGQ